MLHNPSCIDVIISNSANGFQNMSTFFAGIWKEQGERRNRWFLVYLIMICKSLLKVDCLKAWKSSEASKLLFQGVLLLNGIKHRISLKVLLKQNLAANSSSDAITKVVARKVFC